MSYNTLPNNGSNPNLIHDLNNEIDHTKVQLLNTCEKICQRDETINNISDKAETLSVDADIFRNQSRRLKNKMWWKETNFYIGMVILFVFIVIIIILSVKKN